MQSDLRKPPAVTPGTAILNAPGSWRRIAALVLAVLAMLLPAMNSVSFGVPIALHLPKGVPWALLFPVLLTLALLVPAIPPAAPWLRLLDIASAVLGGAILIFLVLDMIQANSTYNAAAGSAGLTDKELQARLMGNIRLGIGTYVLFAATVAASLAAMAQHPRAAA